MINLKQAQARQDELQEQAKAIMNKYSIVETLSELGEVEFDGSYKYGLMAVPDVDIEIYNPELTADKVFAVGKKFFDRLHRLYVSDRTSLPFKVGRPNGVYLGLFVDEDGVRWTFDVWTMRALEDKTSTTAPGLDHGWFEKTSQEERDYMLLLKHRLLDIGIYGNKIGSFHLYQAVLEGARSVEDFKKWVLENYQIDV